MNLRPRVSGRSRTVLALALAAAMVTGAAMPPGDGKDAAARASSAGAARAAVHSVRNLPTSLLVTLRAGAALDAVDNVAGQRGLVRVGWDPLLRTAQYVSSSRTDGAGVRAAIRGAGRADAKARSRLARLGDGLDRLPGVTAADVPAELTLAEDPPPASEPTPLPSPVAPPNDPYWPSQWAPEAMGARVAWALTRGRPEIVVAVLDTGVDLGHPDLAARLVPGTDTYDGDGNPTDENGHGTHVAGIIAAVAGNAVGISGIAPAITLMPVKVFGAGQTTGEVPVVDGIKWAVAHGARVINLSLSSRDPSTYLDSAIDYAVASGVVVVVAAGNTASTVGYPAKHPPALAVAALEDRDPAVPGCAAAPYGSGDFRHASYSNAGPEVDIAAPGSCILSTYLRAAGASYAWASGTSMATPAVAAAAALVLSRDPSRTPAEVEAALTSTALDLGVPGRDDETGAGLVQAGAAEAAVARPAADDADPVARWSGIRDGTLVRGTRSITASATDASPIVAMRLYRDRTLLHVRRSSSVTVSFASAAVADGIHRWTAYATDSTLRVGASTVRVLVANRRTPATLSSSLAMTSSARTISRSLTLSRRSPFVARFTGPSTSSLLVRIIDRNGRTVAQARGVGVAALAVTSLAAGRYTLRAGASVSRPGLTLRLSAAWLR